MSETKESVAPGGAIREWIGETVSVVSDSRQKTTWCVESNWRDRLFSTDAPDWFALETSPAAQRVKSGHEREVWRVRLGDRFVYAKVRHIPRGGSLGWLRTAAVRFASSARREWQLARRAAARGVPVVHFAAIGCRCGTQPADILISEAIPNAQTLAQAWSEAAPVSPTVMGRVRGSSIGHGALICSVARLFAHAHQRGFAHHDNHPHNIMVHPSNGGFAALFVDVVPASLARTRAPYRRTLASLAHLDQYFHRVATRTQRLAFLRTYLEYLSIPDGRQHVRWCERQLVPAILRARAKHAARLARRRDHRIWRKGKYFTTFRFGNGSRATVVLDLERRHIFAEPRIPNRSEAEWRNLVRDIERADGSPRFGQHHLKCEVMRPPNWGQRILWTLFGSPHRRAFARAHQLRHRDFTAPLLVAYVEQRPGFIARTFLLYNDRQGNESSRG